MTKYRPETRVRIAHESAYAKKRGVSPERAKEIAREDAPKRKSYSNRMAIGERPK